MKITNLHSTLVAVRFSRILCGLRVKRWCHSALPINVAYITAVQCKCTVHCPILTNRNVCGSYHTCGEDVEANQTVCMQVHHAKGELQSI